MSAKNWSKAYLSNLWVYEGLIEPTCRLFKLWPVNISMVCLKIYSCPDRDGQRIVSSNIIIRN